jgi:hypothetical protein
VMVRSEFPTPEVGKVRRRLFRRIGHGIGPHVK